MKRISAVWLWAIVFIFLYQSADVNGLLNTDGPNAPDVFVNYRLPNETYPEHYNINIITDVHLGKRAFQGKVTIDIVVVTSTSNIVLNAAEMEISNVSIVSSSGQTEELSHDYELERQFLILSRKSGEVFKAATKWKLTILYNGMLCNDLKGFHLLNNTDENGQDHYVAATFFDVIYARRAFPCYDEPAKRANFTITINHSPNFTAISNMPINDNYSSPGKTVFLTTARIPTFKVAFVVGEFEYTELNMDGIRHRVYSRSSRKSDHQFPLSIASECLNFYAKYYGIDYMMPKFDLLVTTGIEATWESWGLIISLGDFIFNNTNKFSSLLPRITTVLAHQITHQWIGDYVTIQWWSYYWLKEGFAELFAFHAVDKVFPKWDIWEYFHVQIFRMALFVTSRSNNVPLTLYKQTPSELASTESTFTHYFGASVLRMWENALGEEVFRRAVQNFLKNNQYGAVTDEHLYVELQKSAEIGNIKLPASVSKMVKTWTHQGGFPLLIVSRDYNDGSFTVKQETYYDDKTMKDNKTWYVPINFAVASNADFSDTKVSHYLPNTKEIKIDAGLANHDWIILNKRSEYFYRIQYDENNYKLITQTLIEQPFTIPARNRAQLLEDVYYLTRTKRLNTAVLFEMLTYLTKEDHYAPWSNAFDIIHYYFDLKDNREFSKFVRYLVRPIFKKLGVHKISGEHQLAQNMRDVIMFAACQFQLRECLVATNKRLHAHLFANATIELENKINILSYGLMLANDNEFDILYQRLMESPDEQERHNFITCLSFAQNERHIKKLISSSIDMSNKLLSKERSDLLKLVYTKGKKALLLCIEFLSKNWHAYGNLQTESGDNPLDADIREMAKHVLSKTVKKKFLRLVAKVKGSKHVSENLEQYVRNVINKKYRRLQEKGQPAITWIARNTRSRFAKIDKIWLNF